MHASIRLFYQDSHWLSAHLPTPSAQLARARAVQNDVVMVIFRDGADPAQMPPYDPLVMPTNVTHVFVLVTPLRIDGVLHYK